MDVSATLPGKDQPALSLTSISSLACLFLWGNVVAGQMAGAEWR